MAARHDKADETFSALYFGLHLLKQRSLLFQWGWTVIVRKSVLSRICHICMAASLGQPWLDCENGAVNDDEMEVVALRDTASPC